MKRNKYFNRLKYLIAQYSAIHIKDMDCVVETLNELKNELGDNELDKTTYKEFYELFYKRCNNKIKLKKGDSKK